MTPDGHGAFELRMPGPEMIGQIRSLARPLRTDADLDGLVDRLGGNRYVCIGEASHGTHEYYEWRARLSRRLIEDHGFTWIGVEGDWPGLSAPATGESPRSALHVLCPFTCEMSNVWHVGAGLGLYVAALSAQHG